MVTGIDGQVPSSRVALCEEGVDRNRSVTDSSTVAPVALCEEGVDRNCCGSVTSSTLNWSPSAKRAWIEIVHGLSEYYCSRVALCEEGVDRNSHEKMLNHAYKVALCEEGVDRNRTSRLCRAPPSSWSPSAKRAWIEIGSAG